MLHQKQKITHLVDELLHYVLQAEPQKVTVEIEDLADQSRITVEAIGARRMAPVAASCRTITAGSRERKRSARAICASCA